MPGAVTPLPVPASGQSPSSGARYPAAVIAMHWLTLALLVAVYTLIELKGYFPKGSDTREALKSWHELCGVTVLGVVIVRLFIRRACRGTPPIVPNPPQWQQILAKAMHVILYMFLIAMPVLGWFVLSAKGQLDLPLGLHLMPLIAPDKPLGKTLEDIHETIGNVGYYLIGLHALAALFHHYWMRDNTLRRMLP